MSPTALATLRRIERDTRRIAGAGPRFTSDGWEDQARYPVDYWRPAELLRRWRGPGRFFSVAQ